MSIIRNLCDIETRMHENISCVLERIKSLDFLMRSSASCCRAAEKKHSFASQATTAISGLVFGAAALGGAAVGRLSSLARPTRPAPPALLSPTCEVPAEDVAIPKSGKYFEGVLQHNAFGTDEVVLKLILDKFDGEGRYLGRWTAVGQVEAIVLTFDAATGAVTIVDQSLKKTCLRGSLCFDSGSLSGVVIQGGAGGGSFRLFPKLALIALKDTDGDQLVFARLLGGGVAEYCNSELVVPSLRAMSMNNFSGLCEDGEGRFTVPAIGRSDVLASLESFLKDSGVPVTLAK